MKSGFSSVANLPPLGNVGGGRVVRFVPPDPAGGAAIVLNIPDNYGFQPLCLTALFTAGAAVANRNAVCSYTVQGVGEIIGFSANVVVALGVQNLVMTPGNGTQSFVGGRAAGFIAGTVLVPGGIFSFTYDSIQAADVIQQMVLTGLAWELS